MRLSPLPFVALIAAGLVLSGCAASDGNVITPVVRDAGSLQGETVELVVGQMLSINTGDLAVDSYTGTVSDDSVAEFVAGKDDGSATFNPGVRALAEGTTEVTMKNDNGGIQPLEFTVEVSAAP